MEDDERKRNTDPSRDADRKGDEASPEAAEAAKKKAKERHTRYDFEDDVADEEQKKMGISSLQMKRDREAEDRYDRDAREVEELNRRIKERDDLKTKRKGDVKTKAMLDIEQKREEKLRLLKLKNDELRDRMDRQRVLSRREYLARRQDKQLELLRREIEDFKEMFRDVQLTDAEEKELHDMEELYRISVERDSLMDDEEEEGFDLSINYEDPEGRAKKKALLTQREKEAGKKKKDFQYSVKGTQPLSEQMIWEDNRIAQATKTSYGARDKGVDVDQRKKDLEDDLILEEEVEFVMASLGIKGTFGDEDDSSSSYVKTEGSEPPKVLTSHQKILEDRRKLPVFKLREELLQVRLSFSFS